MARRTEDELFERFRARREPAALAEVFDRTAADLLRVALHLCGRRADAEDLVQQTFLVAIERAASWDRARGLFPWLVGILTNQARLRRRSERRTPDAARLSERSAADPRVEAERAETEAGIRRAVAELGEVYGPVLRLHLEHGLDCNEIARALDRPAGTVRTQLVRGLAQLRRALPAGLGVLAAATVGAGRGLAAVREVVLAGAREAAAAAATTAGAAGGGVVTSGTAAAGVLAGVFTMHKVFGLLCAAVVVWALWWAVAPPASGTLGPNVPAPVASPAVGTVADDAATGADEPRVLADEAQREAAVAPTGRLRVRVRGVVGTRTGYSTGDVEETVFESGTGAAVAGVFVQAWPGESDEAPFDDSVRSAFTDVVGDAVFDGLPAGPARCALRLGFGSIEGAPRPVAIPGAGEALLEIDLMMVARVHGRVVDDAGRPVPGAEVWTSRHGSFGATSMPPEQILRRAAIADASGAFAFVRSGDERDVGARLPGRGVSRWQPMDQLGDGEILLRLAREQGTVRGRVVDPSGRPVAGAVIGIESLDRRGFERHRDGSLAGDAVRVLLRTDADGTFGPEALPAGFYSVRVTAAPLGETNSNFRLEPLGSEFLDVTMVDAITVVAHVQNQRGEPVRALLTITFADGGEMTGATSLHGRAVFERVRAKPFVLAVGENGAGDPRVQREFAPPFTGVRDRVLHVDLLLRERPGIRGRVVGADGSTLSGWRVTATWSGGERATLTAADGTFALGDLAPEPHRLLVRPSHVDRGAPSAELAAIAPGSDDVILRVPSAALPTGSVRGRVVDGDGRPLAATVTWRIGELAAPPQPAHADGRFLLDGLFPGTAYVTASAPGHLRRTATPRIVAGAVADVGDLVLAREAVLRIRFLRPDGTPWREHLPIAWLRRGDARPLRANAEVVYADDGGELVLRHVEPGRYTITPPEGDDLMFDEQEVELRAGEPLRLELAARIGRFVRVHFESPPIATPPERAHVEIRTAGGEQVLAEDRPVATMHVARTLSYGRHVVEAKAGDLRWRLEFDVGEDSPRSVRAPLVPR